MARRNRVPESVSMETPKAKALQRRRETEEIQRRAAEHPDISAVSAKTRKWQKEHKEIEESSEGLENSGDLESSENSEDGVETISTDVEAED